MDIIFPVQHGSTDKKQPALKPTWYQRIVTPSLINNTYQVRNNNTRYVPGTLLLSSCSGRQGGNLYRRTPARTLRPSTKFTSSSLTYRPVMKPVLSYHTSHLFTVSRLPSFVVEHKKSFRPAVLIFLRVPSRPIVGKNIVPSRLAPRLASRLASRPVLKTFFSFTVPSLRENICLPFPVPS